jgi:hypothetical protein
MGNVKGISHDQFPRQSEYVGHPTGVTFGYDLKRTLAGVIVRDDIEAPWETIIRLDDGRFVRGVECQYSPWDVPQP